MAEPTDEKGGEPGQSDLSFKSWLVILIVLSLLAAGAGGGLGMALSSSIASKEETGAEQIDKTADTGEKKDGEQIGAALVDMPPILTNLDSNEAVWVRIEASLIFAEDPGGDGNKLALEIAGDLLAFLRNVKLVHLTGASGLLHLRTDFTEIAQWRSQGRVSDVVIKTLVVD